MPSGSPIGVLSLNPQCPARPGDAHYGSDGIDYAAMTLRLDNSELNAGTAAIGDTYFGIEGLLGGSVAEVIGRTQTNDRILYNPGTGQIFYDSKLTAEAFEVRQIASRVGQALWLGGGLRKSQVWYEPETADPCRYHAPSLRLAKIEKLHWVDNLGILSPFRSKWL